MIKFEKLTGRVREYVISSDIYDVDEEGYVTEEGKRIDGDELLTQMVYASVISADDADAQDVREWF